MARKILKSRVDIEREEARTALFRMLSEAGDTRSEAEIVADAERACYYTPEEAEMLIRDVKMWDGPMAAESSDGNLVFITKEERIADIRSRTRR